MHLHLYLWTHICIYIFCHASTLTSSDSYQNMFYSHESYAYSRAHVSTLPFPDMHLHLYLWTHICIYRTCSTHTNPTLTLVHTYPHFHFLTYPHFHFLYFHFLTQRNTSFNQRDPPKYTYPHFYFLYFHFLTRIYIDTFGHISASTFSAMHLHSYFLIGFGRCLRTLILHLLTLIKYLLSQKKNPPQKNGAALIMYDEYVS